MKEIGQISSFQSVKCLILLFGVVRPGAYLRRGVKGGAAPAPMPYPCMDTINQLSVKIKPITPQRKAFTRNIEVSLNFPGSERIYTLVKNAKVRLKEMVCRFVSFTYKKPFSYRKNIQIS